MMHRYVCAACRCSTTLLTYGPQDTEHACTHKHTDQGCWHKHTTLVFLSGQKETPLSGQTWLTVKGSALTWHGRIVQKGSLHPLPHSLLSAFRQRFQSQRPVELQLQDLWAIEVLIARLRLLQRKRLGSYISLKSCHWSEGRKSLRT